MAAVLFLPCLAIAQQKKDYTLAVPNGWTTEQFSFPIEFAPKIPYRGQEDLRFAPGWADPASEEHWSYAFLWWLERSPMVDANTLEEHLKAYYTGLVGRNITQRRIPSNKVIPVTTRFKKAKTADNDIATYSGTIRMLDYHAQRPITLNCQVHVRSCKKQRRTAVFFEVSPKPEKHPVWKTFGEVWNNFSCGE